MLLPAGFSVKLHAQDTAQRCRYSIQVTQVSKKMEVEQVTCCELDYLLCHTLSVYKTLGEWCISVRAKPYIHSMCSLRCPRIPL